MKPRTFLLVLAGTAVGYAYWTSGISRNASQPRSLSLRRLLDERQSHLARVLEEWFLHRRANGVVSDGRPIRRLVEKLRHRWPSHGEVMVNILFISNNGFEGVQLTCPEGPVQSALEHPKTWAICRYRHSLVRDKFEISGVKRLGNGLTTEELDFLTAQLGRLKHVGMIPIKSRSHVAFRSAAVRTNTCIAIEIADDEGWSFYLSEEVDSRGMDSSSPEYIKLLTAATLYQRVDSIYGKEAYRVRIY